MAPKQMVLTTIFERVTVADHDARLRKVAEAIAEDIRMKAMKRKHEGAPKRFVGRPRTDPKVVLFVIGIKEEDEGDSLKAKKKKLKRGTYTNWFDASLWPPIYAAVTRHRSLSAALNYLRAYHKTPGQICSPYDKLYRGSLVEWFTPQGVLKEKFRQAIDRGTASLLEKNHLMILEKHSQLRDEICEVLRRIRADGQPFNVPLAQPIIQGIIRHRQPQLLADVGLPRRFRVTLRWTRLFLQTHLNWSYRKSTTAASKLPPDWEHQGKLMAMRVAYLVKLYSIPVELIVNTDQTGLHVVPTGGERTWEMKGVKHIHVLGIEDKRQVTVVISTAANGKSLPLQVITSGITSRSLPPASVGREKCIQAGFHFTNSCNHWSIQETSKQFIEKNLLPYYESQCKSMNLLLDQKLIWLVDCWSVYLSAEFRKMVKGYPWICLLYIPANCTSKLQPADVVLQRPLKHAFKKEFNAWTSSVIRGQLDNGKIVKVDLRLANLKKHLHGWFFSAWMHINNLQEIVKRGWTKTGLQRALNHDFQLSAMEPNIAQTLFKSSTMIADKEKNEDYDTPNLHETDPIESTETVMLQCITKSTNK